MDPVIILVLVLLLLSALFSAAETAMMTLSPAKVRTLVEAKKAGAKKLEKLKTHPHRTLITILIGNNLVNMLAASLTTVLMTKHFGAAGVGIAAAVLTVVVLVFGEVMPKTLSTTYAKPVGLFLSAPLYFLSILFTPIIFLLDGLVKGLLKLFGASVESQVTYEELIAMASIGAEEGTINEQEREFIENVLDFEDLKVEEVMTPRVHIDAMPVDFTLKEAAQYIIHHTHSRIPVYRETLDNIVGILSVKELLKDLHESADEDQDERTLRQVDLMTPLKVSHRSSVQSLFRQFKLKKTHMAIVLDEHGGTAGITTMEDLLEEIVGDIEDEEDQEEEWIVDKGKGVYELSPRLDLEDLEELTQLELNYPENKTLSYLLVDKLGSLPKVGNVVTVGDWEFEIVQMWRHTILKVKAKRLKEAPTDEPKRGSRAR